ncbi:MAG TPA: hypothetical protein PKY08_03780 [Candidatus Magasanikbacteria bacterium]|nr:hypothetical protein [Candidatus Magasanikbacteria bacterium]
MTTEEKMKLDDWYKKTKTGISVAVITLVMVPIWLFFTLANSDWKDLHSIMFFVLLAIPFTIAIMASLAAWTTLEKEWWWKETEAEGEGEGEEKKETRWTKTTWNFFFGYLGILVASVGTIVLMFKTMV